MVDLWTSVQRCVLAAGGSAPRSLLNFGANDGEDGDPLYDLVQSGFHGVLVEPHLPSFERLRRTLGKLGQEEGLGQARIFKRRSYYQRGMNSFRDAE